MIVEMLQCILAKAFIANIYRFFIDNNVRDLHSISIYDKHYVNLKNLRRR